MAFDEYDNWGTVDTGVSFKAISSAPIDSRFVIDSLDNLDTKIPKSIRYPGLRVFVIEESREYWFKDGIENSDVVVYTPSANLTGSSLSGFETSTLSEGAEATIMNGGNASKYVWNGSEWKLLASTNASVSPSPTGGSGTISILYTESTTDTYEELSALLTEFVADNDIALNNGVEIPVFFSDTNSPAFFNRYIYLPDLANYAQSHWYIENGVQAFDIQIPNAIINGVAGDTYTSSDTTSGEKYITYNRTENGVDVVIQHNFCNLYVDVVVYEKGSESEDIDNDGTLDTDYGTIVGIPSTCVKSGNKYKVVISFPMVPSATDRFTVLVQK